MSSCLSGGGRTYRFDLDIIKSPSPLTCSQSSSPSSTLSESSSSPIAISTRKPRTPRKRPNQSCSEAAALLSTIYPNIFTTKNLKTPSKHLKSYDCFSESSELLPPFPVLDTTCYLLHQQIPEKPVSRIEPKAANSSEKTCGSPADIDFQLNSPTGCNTIEDDFDVESILDEEMEEGVIGIDSIMGNLSVNKETCNGPNNFHNAYLGACYGSPMGLGFGGKFRFEFGGCVRALRQGDDGEWWRNPTVEILDIIPKPKPSSEKKKKKKKVVEEHEVEEFRLGEGELKRLGEEELKSNLCLKLNYEEVLNAWSGSPFSDEFSAMDSTESSPDAIARLAQFDLISGIGGMREARVMRYKEKRRTRLFSKTIRYEVRKVNADRRPRMKGRFVRRSSGPSLLQQSGLRS